MKLRNALALALTALLAASALAQEGGGTSPPPEGAAAAEDCVTVRELVKEKADEFDILDAALEAAKPEVKALLNNRQGGEPLTIFAPSNAAFEKAFQQLDVTAEEVLANKTLLTMLLKYHVVPGEKLTSEQLKEKVGQKLATAEGEELQIMEAAMEAAGEGGAEEGSEEAGSETGSEEGGGLAVKAKGGVAQIVAPDNEACNAVVHVVDAVLNPYTRAELKAMLQARAGAAQPGQAQPQPGQAGPAQPQQPGEQPAGAEAQPATGAQPADAQPQETAQAEEAESEPEP